jgi:hypothetical protein
VARFTAVTDDDLARARRDPAFRQQLLAKNLNVLIDELNRRKQATRRTTAATARELREGAELAVRLADIIAELDRCAQTAAETRAPATKDPAP